MRRTPVLIAGGGPAGAAAAIVLARDGARPVVVDRGTGPRDLVCGGFLGWDALAALRALGIEPAALGARPITRLRLVAAGRVVEAALPHAAAGLSRRTLDAALLEAAGTAGAEVRGGQVIRAVEDRTLRLANGADMAGEALFLATGKHEVRGAGRPTGGRGLSVGLRAALPVDAARSAALAGTIELHFVEGGYAGLLLQEDGRTNFCLSIETARVARAGGAAALIDALGRAYPRLGARLDGYKGPFQAVAGVPYGWRATAAEAPGVWRIGDQAAVIASLAGDGVAIALTSGASAATAFLAGSGAGAWQRGFARRSARPLMLAETLRFAAERPAGQRALAALAGWSPALARLAARLTRIG